MYFFKNTYLKYQSYLIYIFPLFIATGPFFPDLIISLSSIFFILYCFTKKKFFYFQNKFFLIFSIWCLYLIFNSLLSSNIVNSLESSLFYIRFGVFACCIYCLIVENEKFLLNFTYWLFFIFVFILADAYFQYFFGYNFLGYSYDQVRLSGITGKEQILGSYISRLFPLLFGLIIYNFRSKKFITLSFVLLIMSDVIIYLSGERTAFFNLFLFTFLVLILTTKKRLFRIFTIIFSIIIIISISMFDESTKNRMFDLTISEISGSSLTDDHKNNKSMFSIFGNKFYLFTYMHTAHYLVASKMFADNILFGIGPKNFRIRCNDEKYYLDFGCQSHPHNTYFQLLSETGIIGSIPVIILFIALSLLFFNYIFFNKYELFNKKNEYLTCLLICLYISIWPVIPSGNFFNNWLSCIYYLPIGFILAELNKKLN